MNMELFYRDITEKDLPEWERLACNEFSAEDFCSADYLLENWDKIKGWVLYTQDNEWVGCCFNSWKHHSFNPDGMHFLEACIFPQFKEKGYSKYLIKLNFDYATGYRKSVCINPENHASIALCTKYGFKPASSYKCWTVFICDEDTPSELKDLKLLYMRV
jgi:RimJ/RimL family protein N-acetyltransferase